MSNKLVKMFEKKQIQNKVIELISEGLTYREIALQLGVTQTFVTDTLKTELMSASTPEKILELRQHQTQTLNSHTPKLHKRFITQTDLTQRLAHKYEQYLDEEDQGLYSFPYQYQIHLDSVTQANQEKPEEEQKNQTQLEQQARIDALETIAIYKTQREQIAREMERTSKLADQNYMVLLKHQERLAKLNGLDVPQAHTMLIHRTDEVKVSLQQDILNTQKQIEAQQPVIEAQVVQDSQEDVVGNVGNVENIEE